MGGHAHHHRFDDAEKWAKIFEDSKRDVWQHPEQVIEKVGVKKRSIVADIGSATGYFPVRIAKRASRGRVWGVDVEPNLVNFLNQRARKENLTHLFSVLGTFDDPLIPEPVDFIFMVNTYHHISERIKYLKLLKERYLNKEGKIVIVDFKKGDLPFGPKDPMKIAPAQVSQEFEQAGFVVDQTLSFLPYQYVLVFK